MKKAPVLILGATSDIGLAIAHQFAKEGYPIQLASRDVKRLESDRADLEIRYSTKVSLHEFDAIKTVSHQRFVKKLPIMPGIVVCAVGYMGNQFESERDIKSASLVMRSNFEGPVSILAEFANHFEQRRSGTIIGISSVAGERGRASNYVYGSSKAGFTAFLSGLRNRLADKGVHVMTVLPGFILTKMTFDLGLPPFLTASPNALAEYVYKSYLKKKDIIYFYKRWRLIMVLLCHIPERYFKKMKI